MKDKIKIALLHESQPACSREVAELIGCSTAAVQRIVVDDIDIQRTFNHRVLLRRARHCSDFISPVINFAKQTGFTQKLACEKLHVKYGTFLHNKRKLNLTLEQLERYTHEQA